MKSLLKKSVELVSICTAARKVSVFKYLINQEVKIENHQTLTRKYWFIFKDSQISDETVPLNAQALSGTVFDGIRELLVKCRELNNLPARANECYFEPKARASTCLLVKIWPKLWAQACSPWLKNNTTMLERLQQRRDNVMFWVRSKMWRAWRRMGLYFYEL